MITYFEDRVEIRLQGNENFSPLWNTPGVAPVMGIVGEEWVAALYPKTQDDWDTIERVVREVTQ